VLEQLLAGIENVKVLGTATTVGAGIRLINECQPHLVLLDVEMPPKSGFDLLAAFPNPDFRVIFATAFDKYAIQAIRYAALDYLVKPVDANELATAISRAQALPLVADHRLLELQTMMAPKASIDRIIIPTRKGFQTLRLNEICNVEAESGNYAFFTLASGERKLCSRPLNYYEALLIDPASNSTFFRIHRSCIVNLIQIVDYNSQMGVVTLSNKSTHSVATRRRAAFGQRMRQLNEIRIALGD